MNADELVDYEKELAIVLKETSQTLYVDKLRELMCEDLHANRIDQKDYDYLMLRAMRAMSANEESSEAKETA